MDTEPIPDYHEAESYKFDDDDDREVCFKRSRNQKEDVKKEKNEQACHSNLDDIIDMNCRYYRKRRMYKEEGEI